MEFEQLVAHVSRSYQAVGRPERVLLALSGGADSVALLHTLTALRNREGFSLSAAHVHHGLRPEAEQDAAFVVALCDTMDVPVTVTRVTVGPGNLEAAAREARYQALRARAVETDANVIALAHQADDQAETILMHWMRGAGAAGLAGMRALSGNLWRPLLTVPRQQLIEVLAALGAGWREDATNQNATLVRNALRLQVIPQLRALAPAFDVNVARAARLMAMEEDWADGQAEQWLFHNASLLPANPFLLAEPCAKLPAAMQRRVVRRMCALAGDVPDMDTTDRVLKLLNVPRASVNLPGGGKALRTRHRLHFLAAQRPPMPLGRLHADVSDGAKGTTRGRWQEFDLDAVSGAALRLPRVGDTVAPLGMAGTQPLSKYLGNRAVDLPFRANAPVLARGQDVLWVVGVGISRLAAVTENTRRSVRLTYAGWLPWDLECFSSGGTWP